MPDTESETPKTDEAAAEQPPAEPPVKEPAAGGKPNFFNRFRTWYLAKKKFSIPLTVLALIILILAIPFSRYQTLGLVIKKNFELQVLDSETQSPVSGASVSLGSISSQTDGNGRAVLHAKVGQYTARISKKYYSDSQVSVTVPILSQKNTAPVKLTATGRQVKVTVVNTINQKALAGVTIKVAGINAETDKSGKANIVLPPGVAEQKAELSLNGYNTTQATIKVSDTSVAENTLKITPAGKIYFLSKRTGKIDVMKSNLDGSDQAVVIAGTGSEEQTDTILLASRDWKYLVLKSKRDSGLPKLYYVDTSVDKLNTLDEGDAGFTLIGWSEHNFIYQVDRNGVANWQANRAALKSYDATSGKLIILNQTAAAGSSQNDYAYENYGNNYLIDNTLVFTKTWQHNYYGNTSVTGKNAGVYSIAVDGTGFKTLKTVTYADNNAYYYFGSLLYEPKEIYYTVNSNGDTKYLKYDNGNVTEDPSIADAYNKYQSEAVRTFLLSPSGKQTFWVEPRDGKSSLIVADPDGNNPKTIATLPDTYNNYGYYSDDYLLVSKNNSELYVMPAVGVKDEKELIKITDYHKPAYNFYGYGGGYGGL